MDYTSLQKRLRMPFDLVMALGEAALGISRVERREVTPIEAFFASSRWGLEARRRCLTCAAGERCSVHALPEKATPTPKPELARVRYAHAYAEGQNEATGERFALPLDSGARQALVGMAAAHGRRGDGSPITGEELLAWIRETSAAYRRAKGDAPEYESGFSPRRCLAWLDAGRPGPKAKATTTRQQAPAGGRTWETT